MAAFEYGDNLLAHLFRLVDLYLLMCAAAVYIVLIYQMSMIIVYVWFKYLKPYRLVLMVIIILGFEV